MTMSTNDATRAKYTPNCTQSSRSLSAFAPTSNISAEHKGRGLRALPLPAGTAQETLTRRARSRACKRMSAISPYNRRRWRAVYSRKECRAITTHQRQQSIKDNQKVAPHNLPPVFLSEWHHFCCSTGADRRSNDVVRPTAPCKIEGSTAAHEQSEQQAEQAHANPIGAEPAQKASAVRADKKQAAVEHCRQVQYINAWLGCMEREGVNTRELLKTGE